LRDAFNADLIDVDIEAAGPPWEGTEISAPTERVPSFANVIVMVQGTSP